MDILPDAGFDGGSILGVKSCVENDDSVMDNACRRIGTAKGSQRVLGTQVIFKCF